MTDNTIVKIRFCQTELKKKNGEIFIFHIIPEIFQLEIINIEK